MGRCSGCLLLVLGKGKCCSAFRFAVAFAVVWNAAPLVCWLCVVLFLLGSVCWSDRTLNNFALKARQSVFDFRVIQTQCLQNGGFYEIVLSSNF